MRQPSKGSGHDITGPPLPRATTMTTPGGITSHGCTGPLTAPVRIEGFFEPGHGFDHALVVKN